MKSHFTRQMKRSFSPSLWLVIPAYVLFPLMAPGQVMQVQNAAGAVIQIEVAEGEGEGGVVEVQVQAEAEAEEGVVEQKAERVIELQGGVLQLDGVQLRGNVRVQAAAGGILRVQVGGEEVQVEEQELSPVEAKMEELYGEIIEGLREVQVEEAKGEIGEMMEELKGKFELGDEVEGKLAEAVEEAMGEAVAKWERQVRESLKGSIGESFGGLEELDEESFAEAFAGIKEMLGGGIDVLREMFEEVPLPGIDVAGSDAWKKALQQQLTSEQLIEWDAELAQENKKRVEEMELALDATAENYRRNFENNLKPQVDDVISSLALDDGEREKLDKLVEDAIDDSVDAWKAKARESLESMPLQQLQGLVERGHIGIGWDESMMPQNREFWKSGLAELLGEERMGRWEEERKGRVDRVTETASRALVVAMDDLVALTAEQREQLEVLVRGVAENNFARHLQARGMHFNMNYHSALNMVRQADEKKARDLLTAWQKDLWDKQYALITNQFQGARVVRRVGGRAGRQAGEAEVEGEEEAGEKIQPPVLPTSVATRTEAAINQHVHRLKKQRRDLELAKYTARIEDLARTTEIDARQRRILEIAAKGSAEQGLQSWYEQYVTWVRRNLERVGEGEIEARLAGLGNVQFGRNAAPDEQLWEKASLQALAPEQRASWQVLLDERRAYRDEVTVDLALLALEAHVRLAEDKRGTLRELLVESLATYGPDVDESFRAQSEQNPWYLASHTALVLFEGVPKDKLREQFDEAQWKLFTSQVQPRTGGQWRNIDRLHKERVGAGE
jgi:hypothetical protein